MDCYLLFLAMALRPGARPISLLMMQWVAVLAAPAFFAGRLATNDGLCPSLIAFALSGLEGLGWRLTMGFAHR